MSEARTKEEKNQERKKKNKNKKRRISHVSESVAYQVFTPVKRRLYTGRGAPNEFYNVRRISPHLKIPLNIACPQSRCEGQCAQQVDYLEQSTSVCGLGVESFTFDEVLEYG